MGGETYTQREDIFFPYLLPRARGSQHFPPPPCKHVPRLTVILCILSKSDHVVLITRNKPKIHVIPDIGLAVRVFAKGPGDLGSIPDRVIPKTQKMVLDASLLNTQHYKVWIKGKVEQSRERSSTLPDTLV